MNEWIFWSLKSKKVQLWHPTKIHREEPARPHGHNVYWTVLIGTDPSVLCFRLWTSTAAGKPDAPPDCKILSDSPLTARIIFSAGWWDKDLIRTRESPGLKQYQDFQDPRLFLNRTKRVCLSGCHQQSVNQQELDCVLVLLQHDSAGWV